MLKRYVLCVEAYSPCAGLSGRADTEVLGRGESPRLSRYHSVFCRISGRGCSNTQSSLEDHIDLRGTYWSYSKVPFKHSLIAFESHELDDIAVRMFNSTLVYTGLESVGLYN